MPIIYTYKIDYVNNILKRVLTENGYIENNVYHYYIKDHLASNSIVINQSGVNVQTTSYYPFGMQQSNATGTDGQLYKYTGKEYDQKHGLNLYNYDARFYDPALCRFMTIDPMAEKYYSISPYAYCANNPLKFIDPTGMVLDDFGVDKGTGILKKIRVTEDEFDLVKVGKFDDNGNFDEDKSIDPLKLSKGQLKGYVNEDLSKKLITFTNVEEGVDFMKFVSWNIYKELNAWAYKDKTGERLEVGAWYKNTATISFPPIYKKNAVFNIHTHPGTKNGVGGYGDPSPSDWTNFDKHPYKGHYILSRRYGLVQHSLISKESYTPIKKDILGSLRKFIH